LILPFLLIFISGCSREPLIIEQPIEIQILGDDAFLEPTILPDNPEPTVGGFIDYMIDCRQAVKQCNADKAAYRSMVKDQIEEAEKLKEDAE